MIYNSINHETIRLRKNYGIYIFAFFREKTIKIIKNK